MKATLDMSELRNALSEAITKIGRNPAGNEKMLDASVVDHLQEQFDVEGMTEDGATGTFTPNDPYYDAWKRVVYGETRRMHKTHRLRDNVRASKLETHREGDEIVFSWSWDAVDETGFNYGDYYQNDPSEKGRRLVLTEPFLDELGEMIAEEVASVIEEAF